MMIFGSAVLSVICLIVASAAASASSRAEQAAEEAMEAVASLKKSIFGEENQTKQEAIGRHRYEYTLQLGHGQPIFNYLTGLEDRLGRLYNHLHLSIRRNSEEFSIQPADMGQSTTPYPGTGAGAALARRPVDSVLPPKPAAKHR